MREREGTVEVRECRRRVAQPVENQGMRRVVGQIEAKLQSSLQVRARSPLMQLSSSSGDDVE